MYMSNFEKNLLNAGMSKELSTEAKAYEPDSGLEQVICWKLDPETGLITQTYIARNNLEPVTTLNSELSAVNGTSDVQMQDKDPSVKSFREVKEELLEEVIRKNGYTLNGFLDLAGEIGRATFTISQNRVIFKNGEKLQR